MLDGRTPFYNKNRKYMFHCIVHVRPTFPPHFSKPAKHLLFRLLEPDPARRFGSGEKGAREIMEHEFFGCVWAFVCLLSVRWLVERGRCADPNDGAPPLAHSTDARQIMTQKQRHRLRPAVPAGADAALQPEGQERSGHEVRPEHLPKDAGESLKLFLVERGGHFDYQVDNVLTKTPITHIHHHTQPKESHAEPTGAGRCAAAAHEFKSFTYTGDGHLS